MKKSVVVKNVSKIYRIYNDSSERFKEIISNGRKVYGKDKYALKDISLEVQEGEIVGIIGVNGSGKSTLLKIITGVLQPTNGSVEVNGKISSLLELGAGFNPEYTGIENIYFNGMLMGFSRKEMDEKLQEIVEFADIGEYIYQPVRTYSSGMYVRLAYSIAVSIEPDILIVDEALAVGDAYFQLKSMSKMQELFKKGKTVFLVSHDIGSVKSLCTRAIYLENGEIVAQGNVKEIADMYETKVRKVMSAATEKVDEEGKKDGKSVDDLKSTTEMFIEDKVYCDRIENSREGNGLAKVVGLKLLNLQKKEIIQAEFNQECILKMYIIFCEKCNVCIGYHIRDEKNIPVLGTNTTYEGIEEFAGNKGDKLIVEFKFRVPLREGRYNIMTVLSSVEHINLTSSFVDITKDGYYFDVEQAKPYRIWNTLQLPNEVKVRKYVD
ncbi:MAG: ABC transporter ATP-binding protein [Lachnospiraceae bacterium]|nr:ABC transporter ATP-binding protein [Lachnospiraceae bacterium]